jgi:hypothetical protein
LPEVIDRVEANERHAKETDPFDAIVVSQPVTGGRSTCIRIRWKYPS